MFGFGIRCEDWAVSRFSSNINFRILLYRRRGYSFGDTKILTLLVDSRGGVSL